MRKRAASINSNYTLENSGHRGITATRTAAVQAQFLLPHLTPGMLVLDAGCGSGSITLGIAAVVAPGKVTGIDLAVEQVQQAARSCVEQGIPNVEFLVADACQLPFADESFDAVFSNTLLEHLSDPARALAEFWRVVKRGGLVGVRNGDIRGNLLYPANSLMLEGLQLANRLREHTGGSWCMGPETRTLMRKAGFRIIDAGASYESYVTKEAIRLFAEAGASMYRGGAMAKRATDLGWTDRDRLEQIARACLDWAEDPDAFEAFAHVHVLGVKD